MRSWRVAGSEQEILVHINKRHLFIEQVPCLSKYEHTSVHRAVRSSNTMLTGSKIL